MFARIVAVSRLTVSRIITHGTFSGVRVFQVEIKGLCCIFLVNQDLVWAEKKGIVEAQRGRERQRGAFDRRGAGAAL